MLPSYLLIMKMKFMEGTSQLHPPISLIMKNIMKSRRSFITKELHPVSNISSNGRAILLKKTLGFLKWSYLLPENSFRNIKTPFILPIPQPSAKPNLHLTTNPEIMTSPIPHSTLSYIQYGIQIYTPNTAADALLDAALQDSRLASTLDRAINPQSSIGFIREAYTHHMAMRNALISLVEHIPHHQEIRTLSLSFNAVMSTSTMPSSEQAPNLVWELPLPK